VSPTTTWSPLDDHLPVDDPGIVGGALTPHQHNASTCSTWTRSAKLDQPLRPGEELRPEVCHDPEREDVDAHLVDDPGQLLDLRGL
jgi:hypothetical protein